MYFFLLLLYLFHTGPLYYRQFLGYKSIERRDYSIDSKTESIYRLFTGSSSLGSKDYSLGSINNQNISLCSSNSINLDVKNYKNQYTIKEEEDTNEKKITFV